MIELSTTTAEFRGIPLGRGSSWPIRAGGLAGWAQTPGTSKAVTQQAGSVGWQASPVEAGGRTVILAGVTEVTLNRDELVAQFAAAFGLHQDPWAREWLTVTAGGRQLSAYGQLTDASLGATSEGWGIGRVPWSLVFQCDDGRLYGPERTVSGAFATPGAGIAFPLVFPITFPAAPLGADLTAVNDGPAPAHAEYRIWGGAVSNPGWINTSTGQRVTYGAALVEGQTLVLDTRVGAGLADGAYRMPDLGSTPQGEFLIEPGPNGIQPAGVMVSGAPMASVTWRSAYWL